MLVRDHSSQSDQNASETSLKKKERKKYVGESGFNIERSSTYNIIIRIQSFSILGSIFTQASCIGGLALPTRRHK